MPHLTYEYTANLGDEADIPGLLQKSNEVLIAQGGVFPIGGMRSRAICLEHWCMADGAADYAFVHASLKIGAGRSAEEKRQAGDALFAMIEAHFAAVFARHYLALSLEIAEFSEAGNWKHNNVRASGSRVGCAEKWTAPRQSSTVMRFVPHRILRLRASRC